MPTPTPQAMRAADWLMLAALSVLWGGSFLFIGIAVKELPALTIVAGRVALAAAILLVLARLSGLALPWHRWKEFFILALLGNTVPFGLIAWGQHHIPSGLASILNATTPLFTVIVLRLATAGDRISGVKAAGLALGFFGVCVLIGPKALDGAHMGLMGAVAVLCASFCYGLSGLWARKFSDMAPTLTSAGAMVAATVQSVPVALLVDRPWGLSPGWQSIACVVALATLSSALAYQLFYRVMRNAGPANASLVTFLVPVSAILLGALVLEERLSWNAFAGMALIFGGLAAIDGRLFARRRAATP